MSSKQRIKKYEIDHDDDAVWLPPYAKIIGVHKEGHLDFVDVIVHDEHEAEGPIILTPLLILRPGQRVPVYAKNYQLIGQLIKTDSEMIGPDVVYVFQDEV